MQPHSVKFGDKDSWGDFGLLLLSREIEYPTPKTKMVDVPGSNSYIDLTEAVSSEVKYKNRKLSFKFMLYSYQRILTPVPMPFWQEIIDNIAGFLRRIYPTDESEKQDTERDIWIVQEALENRNLLQLF